MNTKAEETEAITEALFEAFPNGFERCSTLFSEMKSPRIATEITLFLAPSGDGIFVAWVAINFNDSWALHRVRFNWFHILRL